MKSKALILMILLAIHFIPVVQAEDALEWYVKGQNAVAVGNYAEAVTYYTNALSLDRNYAAAMAGKAVALNKMGNYAEAITLSEQALSIKPMDQDALNARAYGLFRLGRYEESVTAYDKLFLFQQNSVDAYYNQGYAYIMLNRSDAAVASLDKCTALNPQKFEAWNLKGEAFLVQGKYDKALDSLERATVITIKNATVWNNKGRAYAALGKPQDALQCFNKALGLDPGFTDARINKESVMGKQQVVNISGTITPTVTISRIGTFYTTVTPVPLPTAGVTMVSSEKTNEVMPTTAPVARKTTYTPISLLPVSGAVIVVAGILQLFRKQNK